MDMAADECLFSIERIHGVPDAPPDGEDVEVATFMLRGDMSGRAFMRDVARLRFLP